MKFCESCGSRLIEGGQIIDRYNSETGEPIYKKKLQCEKINPLFILWSLFKAPDDIGPHTSILIDQL